MGYFWKLKQDCEKYLISNTICHSYLSVFRVGHSQIYWNLLSSFHECEFCVPGTLEGPHRTGTF